MNPYGHIPQPARSTPRSAPLVVPSPLRSLIGVYQGVIVAGDPTGAWTPSLIVVAEPDPVPWTPGDIDGDNRVGGADLGLMLANWGSPSNPRADLNGDGAVSGADLGLLLSRWTN